ncbi:MAG TPA: hypothetical protein VF718_11545 [Allosphingosinicella sp.]
MSRMMPWPAFTALRRDLRQVYSAVLAQHSSGREPPVAMRATLHARGKYEVLHDKARVAALYKAFTAATTAAPSVQEMGSQCILPGFRGLGFGQLVLTARVLDRIWDRVSRSFDPSHLESFEAFVERFSDTFVIAAAAELTDGRSSLFDAAEIPSTRIWVYCFKVRTGHSPPWGSFRAEPIRRLRQVETFKPGGTRASIQRSKAAGDISIRPDCGRTRPRLRRDPAQIAIAARDLAMDGHRYRRRRFRAAERPHRHDAHRELGNQLPLVGGRRRIRDAA